MRIGVPKELKNSENRVALTPDGAGRLTVAGHTIVVERGAGLGSGFADADYTAAGARLATAEEAWHSDLVVKVKEPLEAEFPLLGEQMLFTYLHLAGVDSRLTEALLSAGTTAIAYETVEDASGRLPLLAPMSAVAGSMAPVVGNCHLASNLGGRGMLIAEILGERSGKVAIVGDGVVGSHAAKVAAAMGGHVTVFSRHAERRRAIEAIGPGVAFALSSEPSITRELPDTDLLVGAVLVEGARAPHVVTESMVAAMPEGSVIVDVSIDQGGCIATSRPTSHTDPVFTAHGVIHYCVTNMPGAFPRTSTLALTRATLPRIEQIAGGGFDALLSDAGLRAGVNIHAGRITCEPVAEALGRPGDYSPLAELLA